MLKTLTLISLVLWAGTQTPPVRPGSAIITGTVVEDDTNRPIDGARVTRWLATNALRQFEVITDAQGRFAFRNVEAGDQTIVAELPSYRSGQVGRRRPEGPARNVHVGEAEVVHDVTLRMFGPQSAIVSGVVTDDRGEPAAGVTVGALQRRPIELRSYGSQLSRSPYVAQTDDRGVYRLAVDAVEAAIVVSPVLVTTIPDAANLRGSEIRARALSSGILPPSLGSPLVLDGLVAYLGSAGRSSLLPEISGDGHGFVYPLAATPALAADDNVALLALQRGAERAGVDLRLHRTAARVVTGTVVGPDGPISGIGVRLVPWFGSSATVLDFDVAATVTRADGSFVMVGVPPGDYRVRAGDRFRAPVAPAGTVVDTGAGGVSMQGARAGGPATAAAAPLLWAEMPLVVGQSDATGVVIRAAPGVRVSGQIVFDGSSAAPTPPANARVSISLFGSNAPAVAAPTIVDASGSFVTAQFPPGSYTMSVSGVTGWAVSSVMHRDRDVAANGVDLSSTDLSGVVITMTNKTGTLSGTISKPSRQRDADATAVIFPTGYGTFGGYGSPNTKLKQARAALDGTFMFRGLVPGEYFVAAIDDAKAATWNTAAMLHTLARMATKVVVTEGGAGSVDLVTQVIR